MRCRPPTARTTSACSSSSGATTRRTSSITTTTSTRAEPVREESGSPRRRVEMERVEVAVIGAGPAGLAAGRELLDAGVEFAVLERDRVGQTWRGRWDEFRLVTPNWATQLPGRPYDGPDPDGFMARDEVVEYLERCAADLGGAVREGVEVGSLEARPGGGLTLQASTGDMRADAVVVATGSYRRPHRPSAAAALPSGLLQLDVVDYRNEGELPPGAVL